MNALKKITALSAVGLMALALTACKTEETATSAPQTSTPVVVTTESTTPEPVATTEAPVAEYDPYQYYLDNNPDPSIILSPEDAQTRALLGCGTEWAPDTIDFVLREAYTGICD